MHKQLAKKFLPPPSDPIGRELPAAHPPSPPPGLELDEQLGLFVFPRVRDQEEFIGPIAPDPVAPDVEQGRPEAFDAGVADEWADLSDDAEASAVGVAPPDEDIVPSAGDAGLRRRRRLEEDALTVPALGP